MRDACKILRLHTTLPCDFLWLYYINLLKFNLKFWNKRIFLRQLIAIGDRKDINLLMLKFLDSDTLSSCYWGSFTNHGKSQTNAIKHFLLHIP